EIDAGLARLRHDPGRGGFIGRPAEHHGAKADRRNLQSATAELAVVHRGYSLVVIPGRCASNPESRDSGPGAYAPSRNDGVQLSVFKILNTPLAMAMTRLSTVISVLRKTRLRVARTTRGRDTSISPILPDSTKCTSSWAVAMVCLPVTKRAVM